MFGADRCAPPLADESLPEEFEPAGDVTPVIASLKPLGQLRESFILAVNRDGLWIVDQHCAHERVLFERVSRQRARQQVESQRLLMPIVIELTPAQQAIFSEISDELQKNGFEAEPFGARAIYLSGVGRRQLSKLRGCRPQRIHDVPYAGRPARRGRNGRI